MKNQILPVVLSAVVGCFCVFGDENTGFSGRGRGGERGGRNFNRGERSFNRGGMRGGMRSAFFTEVEIAKKFPEEYARIDAMREQYEAELAGLARKAGVELPQSMDSKMRQLRKADQAGFDAAVEKMKTSSRDGMQMLNEIAAKAGITLFNMPGGRSGFQRPQTSVPAPVRSTNRPNMKKLRGKYPEKMKEYDALRSKDRDAAKKMLLEIIEMDKSAGK